MKEEKQRVIHGGERKGEIGKEGKVLHEQERKEVKGGGIKR